MLTEKVLVRGVEAMGIEPTNLLHAMQALYQLSYAPRWLEHTTRSHNPQASGHRVPVPFSPWLLTP